MLRPCWSATGNRDEGDFAAQPTSPTTGFRKASWMQRALRSTFCSMASRIAHHLGRLAPMPGSTGVVLTATNCASRRSVQATMRFLTLLLIEDEHMLG